MAVVGDILVGVRVSSMHHMRGGVYYYFFKPVL